MNDYKYACVLDANQYYKTLVVLFLAPTYRKEGEKPAMEWVVQHYTLADGEQLVETQQPSKRPHAGAAGIVRPRWDSTAWVEGATAAEISDWEAAHPAPKIVMPPPSNEELAEKNKLLQAQVEALSETNDFHEELIVDLANVVYA